MEKKKKLEIIPIKQILILVFAGILSVYSFANIFSPGMNSVEYILYFINLCVLAYGIFFNFCQKAFSHGILRVVRIIWRILAGIILIMGLLMNVSYYSHSSPGNEKAIIVLGAPLSDEDVSRVLDTRIMTALTLANVIPDIPVILSGGGAGSKYLKESEYMAANLMFYQVDPDRIEIESESMTTAENFKNVAAILKKKGMSLEDQYLVVSSTFHCYRTVCYARDNGMTNITFIGVEPDLQDVPTWYLREIIAIFNYWFTGR